MQNIECMCYHGKKWIPINYSLMRKTEKMELREMGIRNMRGRETCKRLDRYQFN